MLSCKALVGCHGNQVGIGDRIQSERLLQLSLKLMHLHRSEKEKSRVKRSKIFHISGQSKVNLNYFKAVLNNKCMTTTTNIFRVVRQANQFFFVSVKTQ